LETWQKLLSSQKFRRDPLGLALNRKAQLEAPGAAEGKTMAAGDGWRVVDIVCTSGPRDRAFEEQHTWASISLVRSGTFVYRSHHGRSLMAPGACCWEAPVMHLNVRISTAKGIGAFPFNTIPGCSLAWRTTREHRTWPSPAVACRRCAHSPR
jgi:hypothetical protein